MNRLLLDTNVLLDCVDPSRAFHDDAVRLMARCNGGGDMGIASSHSLNDAYYIMSRRYDGDEGKKDVHESHVEYLQHCRKAALYAAARQNWCVIPCSDGSKPRSMDDIAALVLEAAEPLLKQGSPV